MTTATPKRAPKKFRGKPTIVASREAAIEQQYQAGLKHLYRPQDPSDRYHTKEAVLAWAERQIDEFLERGVLVIS